MKVFKFGGGVLKTGKDVYRIPEILDFYKNDKLIIVVSAFNKVTNKFERLLNDWFYKNEFNKDLFVSLKEYHILFATEIIPGELRNITDKINEIFSEIKCIFSKKLSDNYHYEYDRIVSYGEILSSMIIFEFLNQNRTDCKFEDVRNLIITNSDFREAKVNWEETEKNITEKCKNTNFRICVTQGFIASDKNGNTTTLGREGSDFTASVLAYSLDVEEVIFWKEVEGIYNADPTKADDFVLLPKLSYRESLEQAFYGAKILHPKAVKPLQNKKIPIRVRSFYEFNSEGTVIKDISELSRDFYPQNPIFITEENQILISVSTLDFSFISEYNLGKIFGLLSKHRIKVNLMQASAISFSVCVTNDIFKIPELIKELKRNFKVLYNDNLQLITIRHYTDDAVDKMISGKEVILRQISRRTARYLIK